MIKLSAEGAIPYPAKDVGVVPHLRRSILFPASPGLRPGLTCGRAYGACGVVKSNLVAKVTNL